MHARLHRDQRGMTLIEVIILVVVLAIGLPVLALLLTEGARHGLRAERITQATLLAQEKMDQIIAEKRTRGYAYVDSVLRIAGYYDDSLDVATVRYRRATTWQDTTDGTEDYKEVTVTVSADQIPDVVMETWLAAY